MTTGCGRSDVRADLAAVESARDDEEARAEREAARSMLTVVTVVDVFIVCAASED